MISKYIPFSSHFPSQAADPYSHLTTDLLTCISHRHLEISISLASSLPKPASLRILSQKMEKVGQLLPADSAPKQEDLLPSLLSRIHNQPTTKFLIPLLEYLSNPPTAPKSFLDEHFKGPNNTHSQRCPHLNPQNP